MSLKKKKPNQTKPNQSTIDVFLKIFLINKRGICDIKVIVKEKGLNLSSSHPGCSCLYFTLMPLKKAWIHLFSPKLWTNKRIGLFSFGKETYLGEPSLTTKLNFSKETNLGGPSLTTKLNLSKETNLGGPSLTTKLNFSKETNLGEPSLTTKLNFHRANLLTTWIAILINTPFLVPCLLALIYFSLIFFITAPQTMNNTATSSSGQSFLCLSCIIIHE